MKRLFGLGLCALALSLAGCSNDPDEENDAAASAVQSVPIDATIDDTPVEATSDESEPSDTMIRGGSDTAGTVPPKGSKLQRAE